MSFILAVTLAIILDLVFGDPRWLPHPVKLIAGAAMLSEVWSRKWIKNEYTAGFITVAAVLLIVALTTSFFIKCWAYFFQGGSFFGATLLLYTSVAIRDMLVHSKNVYRALTDERILKKFGLKEAGKRVGMIVGRETDNLTAEGISRACVESVAESMVDGITAPLFWAFVGALFFAFGGYGSEWFGGALMAMLYKAVNTMDSMFGYKNQQYQKFGASAARLDDFANYIPARLSALFMVLACPLLGHRITRAWHVLKRDRKKHASPNSGHTEAAMAGALDVTLGGGGVYFGRHVKKPHIGNTGNLLEPYKIIEANRLLLLSSLLFFFFLCLIYFSAKFFLV